MTVTETGIIKAIAYADIFDFPLTKEEVFLWFMGNRPADRHTVLQSLDSLVKKRLIDLDGDYYFLPGKNQVVRVRKNRLKSSTQKYVRAVQVTKRLSIIPSISGIFLTGTVAVNNADLSDDIDLMIVTKPHWLWTTRMAVTGMLELMNVRRKPGQEKAKDTFCVNLYVDESAMAVPSRLQNLYTAHEVVLAKMLYEKEGLARRFMAANRWIKKYLPNTAVASVKNGIAPPSRGMFVENMNFRLQKLYMQPKMTRELVTEQQAYFHPKDMAKIVLSRYDQTLKRYEIG
jgi:hypothetical protein